jgi:hypothetical protein
VTSPTAEDVARRLGRRAGYRLVTYREVGLPFWDMPIKCRLLAKKPLPALDEFVMKCIDVELCTDKDISEFLGLPLRVVEVVMGRLVSSGHLVPRPPTDQGALAFVLTERGRRALDESGEIVAEERDLNVAYDGLLREFALVEPSLRWRPRDLRENDILEIPAFPADPPDIGPTDTTHVGAAIAQITELAEHELLSALGLSGRREKFFIRALAMVFESADKPGDVVVHFAIDGRPSEEHDRAFARAEGQRKLGIVGSLRDARAPDDAILGPSVLKQRADDAEVSGLRRATDSFRNRLGELRERAESVPDEAAQDDLARQMEELQRRLDEAETALARVPARLLEVHEHPELLAEALETAEERLLIVSPWIRAAVVNGIFLQNVEALLGKGVHVAIGFGIDDSKVGQDRDAEAEEKLAALATRYTGFRFVRLGDTHAKVLVLDRRYVIVTSFNWLSFRGDPRRPFRDERGTLVTIPDEIDRIYDDYMHRMDQAAAG